LDAVAQAVVVREGADVGEDRAMARVVRVVVRHGEVGEAGERLVRVEFSPPVHGRGGAVDLPQAAHTLVALAAGAVQAALLVRAGGGETARSRADDARVAHGAPQR